MLKVQPIFVETTDKTDVIDLTAYVKKGVEKSKCKSWESEFEKRPSHAGE